MLILLRVVALIVVAFASVVCHYQRFDYFLHVPSDNETAESASAEGAVMMT